jgi:hypothetical protein
MSALTFEHWHELKHIATVTRDGTSWTFRPNGKLQSSLEKAGYITRRTDYIGVTETFTRCQITPAGIAALATKSEGTR